MIWEQGPGLPPILFVTIQSVSHTVTIEYDQSAYDVRMEINRELLVPLKMHRSSLVGRMLSTKSITQGTRN